MRRTDRIVPRLARGLVTGLLAFYPPGFRREFGESLLCDVQRRAADRLAERRVWGFLLWMWRCALSMIANGLSEWSGMFGDEARQGIRALACTPLSSAIVLGMLALLIGLATTVFGVTRPVLLDPLPYADGRRIVRLYQVDSRRPDRSLSVSAPHFLEYRKRATSFDALAGLYAAGELWTNVTVAGNVERARVLKITPGYFETLRQSAMLGRTLAPSEEHGEPCVVVSERFRRSVGRDGANLGDAVEVEGRRFTIIGIISGEFVDPIVGPVDAWVPMSLHTDAAVLPGNHFLEVLGLLAPGVSADQARGEMALLDQRLARRFPSAAVDGGMRMVSLRSDLMRGAMKPWLTLVVAAVIVLFMAVVSIASMLRLEAHHGVAGAAVSGAIRAGPRIARARLIQGLLLAVAGGALGLGLAAGGLAAIGGIIRDAVPAAFVVRTNPSVALFALGLSVAIGVCCTVAVASSVGQTCRTGVVAAQIALAFVLVAGAATQALALYRLSRIDLGIRPINVLTFDLGLPDERNSEEVRTTLPDALAAKLKSTPGVRAAAATSWLPAMRWAYSWGTAAESGPTAGSERGFMAAEQRIIAGEYFTVMGIPLVAGRLFDTGDGPDAPRVAVVSRLVAERLFPGRAAVGEHIRTGGRTLEIIGVVEDVAPDRLGGRSPHVYHAYRQFSDHHWSLKYLVAGDGALPSIAEVRQSIAGLDPRLAVHEPEPLETKLSRTIVGQRLGFILSISFAALALMLALMSLYGALAHMIQARAAESGLRMARGATAEAVAGRVVGRAVWIVSIGILTGGIASLVLSRLYGALALHTRASEPGVLLPVILTFLLAAGVATAFPAVRAARIRPRRSSA